MTPLLDSTIYRQIIDSLDYGVILFDVRNGRIVHTNACLES